MFLNNRYSQNEIHQLNREQQVNTGLYDDENITSPNQAISSSNQLGGVFLNEGSNPSSTYSPFNLMRFPKIKHQAKNAIALSLLSTFLMIGGTVEAAELKDRENNNSRANSAGTGYLELSGNSILSANGSVSQSDKSDIYSITNVDPGFMHWNYRGVGNLFVYEDTNKNGMVDTTDRYLFRLGSLQQKRYFSSKNTSYIASIQNGSASGSYFMSARANKKVTLLVLSAKNYGKFDGGRGRKHRPDFYLKTHIYNSGTSRSKTFPNNDTPFFNHIDQDTRPHPEIGFVDLSIGLYDSDAFSIDDQADINPNPNYKRMRIVYNFKTKLVKTYGGKVLGRLGQAITVKGNPGKSQASVTFIVR